MCNKAVHAETVKLCACKQPVPLLLRTVRSSALAPSLNDLTTENVVALQHGRGWGPLLCCGDGEPREWTAAKGRTTQQAVAGQHVRQEVSAGARTVQAGATLLCRCNVFKPFRKHCSCVCSSRCARVEAGAPLNH